MMPVALPSLWRELPTLRGQHATVEPLQAAHADGLRAALGDCALSRLLYTGVPAPAQVDNYVAAALAAQSDGLVLPYVVRDAAGEIVGCTRYYGLDATVSKLSIGYTWYALHVQRSGVNTDTKLLLLQHAFETLGCLSVAFETSWFKHTSRAAIARLGARQDDVLRNHTRHADGTLRDTVVFSIIDTEWAGVKRHLQFRLEANA